MFSQKAIDVLVYSGSGVSTLCLEQVFLTCKQILGKSYSVMKVDANLLATQPWEKTTALLAFPGGRDSFYNRDLRGPAAYKIQNYVRSGGKYIGFCAGGYFGCSKIVFEPNTPIQVIGDRPLGFFPGVCKGTAYPGFDYESESGSKALQLIIEKEEFRHQKKSEWIADSDFKIPYVYYNGGGYFSNADEYRKSEINTSDHSFESKTPPFVNILARYPEGVTDPENRAIPVEGAPAIIACHYGDGLAILTGVHVEFSYKSFTNGNKHTLPLEILEKIKSTENERIDLMISLFHYLDLDVTIESIIQEEIDSNNAKELPLKLKWPNDLYYESQDLNDHGKPIMKKLGGLLITSFTDKDVFSVFIGLGINVNNPKPTTSLNSIIEEYNKKNGTRLREISMEEMMASYLEKLEEFYYTFLNRGFEPFVDLYYKHWLHSGQIVSLKNHDYTRVKIVGISLSDGYLVSKSLENPSIEYTLHPDGNSFDFLNGLIGNKK
ncbi:Biotin-protein ligase [Smittium mucronatum]|uniref:Biotin-protein ligase n=1 Tax=Smittium mucronatum TaxID=133383 RepID=A0A1R0GN33_9FUNG|nr:Biotin-protein ligase [Smittium mucronatum]